MPRPFEVWVENLLLPARFRENLISALRWTEFHQNLKDQFEKFNGFQI